MSYRTFHDFYSHRDENMIDSWLSDMPKGVRARLDVMLGVLENVERLERPEVAYLGDKNGINCRGLFEIRVKVNRQEYRPIGFEGPGPRQATLLIGAREKGNKFVNPRDPCKIAFSRIEDVKSGRGYTLVHLT